MKRTILICYCMLCLIMSGFSNDLHKREFRGAWIQTVHQGQYAQMNEQQIKTYFINLLDNLQEAKINAILFQVRPSADAFYSSKLEPISKYLTGKQGTWNTAPWDPTAFLIEECHRRNMEFHAWLNPYRVTASVSDQLADNHLFHRMPELFIKYGKNWYFDPGHPVSRKFFRTVIKDILRRYDVDAIHMDDYFYPYPIAGEEFNDNASFETYRREQGFEANQKAAWRRHNVNTLIQGIDEDILTTKPWVRFGISPFGIYRNKASWDQGSNTRGLQNYDDLNADVLEWCRQGWIDYIIPQLYWEIGHSAADYVELAHWWNKHHNHVALYIGQSISRSLDQGKDLTLDDDHFTQKINLTRTLEQIDGNCFWYGYQITNNERKIKDVLEQKFHRYPALIPSYPHIDSIPPHATKRPDRMKQKDQITLIWKPVIDNNPMQEARYYVVYRVQWGERIDFNDPKNIFTITPNHFITLDKSEDTKLYKFYITAVDRTHNESEPTRRRLVRY